MDCQPITSGVFYVQIPEHSLNILCGCPPDVVKHLMRTGQIKQTFQNGVHFETGPNGILLSDLPIQNGGFTNLAEFPILQMFYRQGMILPGHPNYGLKPLVIGHSRGLSALGEYLFRGTYGLADEGEILAAGMSEEMTQEILREKLWFAFGKIRKSEDLLEYQYLDNNNKTEIRPGLSITRLHINVFRFDTESQSLTIDLNLKPNETYAPPIRLGNTRIKRQYFSVVHIGEGDGWDINRPCTGSLLQFQGKLYLIDAGPNVSASLLALGVSINEIEGIFLTHAHDDHFAGLPALARTDHKMKFFASKLVRTSVMKKMAALMSIPEKNFSTIFDFYDLNLDVWNDVDGLSVMPLWSPHPVETNIFLFRAAWQGGSKSYAHFSDIATFAVLKKMLLQDAHATPFSHSLYHKFTQQLLSTTDLKKVDIGGGMIHGKASDFRTDQSGKIILAHTDRELTTEEKEIGTDASFGIHDTLIEARQDFRRLQAEAFLQTYFPHAPKWELNLLLNCPLSDFSPGTILQRKGESFEKVLLVVTGVAEAVDASQGFEMLLAAGTLIGEFHVLTGQTAHLTWRAKSFVSILEIPLEVFVIFATKNTNIEDLKRASRQTLFLQATRLFGESVSSILLMEIARGAKTLHLNPGERLNEKVDFSATVLFVVEEGAVALSFEGENFETVEAGGFCGEESLFLRGEGNITMTAVSAVRGLVLPGKILRKIPIVEWKILETYERRLSSLPFMELS